MGLLRMLRLSEKWAELLLSERETGMGYQKVSVLLKNGRRYERVLVVDGVISSIEGNRTIPFSEDEIENIVVTHD